MIARVSIFVRRMSFIWTTLLPIFVCFAFFSDELCLSEKTVFFYI